MSDRDPIMTARPSALVCSLADFLCGAEGATPWLQQHFDDYVADLDFTFEPEDVTPVPNHNRYGLVPSMDESSALLLHRVDPTQPWTIGAEVVGYYNPPGAVCLQDAHQGLGLGAELILWTAVHLTGGPPTLSLDEQCFTEAGHRAHQAAWKLGVTRGQIVDPDATPQPATPRRPRP